MQMLISPELEVDLSVYLPARITPDSIPWVPLSHGKAFKPLRFLSDDRGFVELLRLAPGEMIALHRHTGEVHAINLQGSRALSSGEVIGPGGYVYEPVGNVDSWKVVGDTPLIVLVVVIGAVEYLDTHGEVASRWTASRLFEVYHRYCEDNCLPLVDLID
jgi:quercetin dioxygenase-like cupin family protein